MVVQKLYSNEDTLKIFLKIGLNFHYELHVASYSRKSEISDTTYYYWCNKSGRIAQS